MSKNVWNSYFDHSFGEIIDSPQKLRDIEKQKKGAYYSVEEFKKFNEQKLIDEKNRQKKEAKEKLRKSITEIKWGRSFIKELRKEAEKYK